MGKTDAASRRQLFEFARTGLGEQTDFNLPRELAEKSGVSADQFNRTMRRELFDQVKQRAQARTLNPEQFQAFRESAEGLGVTGQMFDSTFQREGITAAVGAGLTKVDSADFDQATGQEDTPAATPQLRHLLRRLEELLLLQVTPRYPPQSVKLEQR